MRTFLCLLLCVSLIGCSASPSGASYESVSTDPLAAETLRQYGIENPLDTRVWEAIRQFAYASADGLLSGEANDNYSPISLYTALAMAATGASSGTADELYGVLGLPKDPDALADIFAKINRLLNVQSDTGRTRLSNSIWNQLDYPFHEAYIHRLQQKFGASLFEVDFTEPETANRMSDWVAKETEGLIRPKFEQTSDYRSVLFNTLYFKESWLIPFSPDRTVRDTFQGSQGDVEKDFLQSDQIQTYIHQGDIEGVILPLEFSRMIILKKSGANPRDILQENLTELIHSGSDAIVTLKLPKFSFDNEYDLIPLLQQMGVSTAFSPRADFSAMTPKDLDITEVRQNSHIGIDETGVEAAAMTMVAFAESAMIDPPLEVELTFDEPFLYMIESFDGLPLFIGTVTQ